MISFPDWSLTSRQQWPDTISRGWSVTTELRSLCADPSPSVNHSILHHQPPPSGSQAYDTLSLESSDSLETSVSTGNSACTPERWETGKPTVSMGTLQSAPSPRKKGHCSLFLWHVLLHVRSHDYSGCCHANPLKFGSCHVCCCPAVSPCLVFQACLFTFLSFLWLWSTHLHLSVSAPVGRRRRGWRRWRSYWRRRSRRKPDWSRTGWVSAAV